MFQEPRTETSGKSVRGRKDSDGVTKVPKKIPEAKYQELDNLCRKARAAGETFNDACTAVGEKYGQNAAVVKKVVKARVADNFDDKQREVEQLAFAFGVIDSVTAPEEAEEPETETE